jgi:NAD dependent epimerase/dehydratase family enzyme
VTNKEFSKALGKAMHRPSFMPTPKVMLKVALGKVATVVTTGQRVVPRKALELGFEFRYAEIGAALAKAVG